MGLKFVTFGMENQYRFTLKIGFLAVQRFLKKRNR